MGGRWSGRLAAVPATAGSAMKLGMVAGGAISLFRNTYRVSKGEVGPKDAALNVVSDSVGTGLATAAGAAAVTRLGLGGVLGVIGFMAVSGLAMGMWDSLAAPQRRRIAEAPTALPEGGEAETQPPARPAGSRRK